MTTYIFDLDGTLLDTLRDLHASVNHALAAHGLPLRTIDEVRNFVGNGVRRLVELSCGTHTCHIDAVFDTFKQHYAEHSMDTTAPYKGTKELLATLKARGSKIAVVSNKVDSATRPLVRQFFGDSVDIAIGEHEGVQRKPAPDMVFEAMQYLGCKSGDDVVYVGDSDVDLATARAANLPCISVLWGFRDRDFLEQHGATMFANTPDDLLKTL